MPSVRMLPNEKPIKAATPTKIAVQAPCVERAFRPMEIPSIADAAKNVKSAEGQSV